jgi:hypothetical protein
VLGPLVGYGRRGYALSFRMCHYAASARRTTLELSTKAMVSEALVWCRVIGVVGVGALEAIAGPSSPSY